VTIALFYHSLVSDWNHGNAHFLRGIVTELRCRGHEVRVFEPERGWSLTNLLGEHGGRAVRAFRRAYPGLRSTEYDTASFDFGEALDGVDLVVAHEWNAPGLLRALGNHRRRTLSIRLLFHDTHHRMATHPQKLAAIGLSAFDGVLSYGEALSEIYRRRTDVERVWTWHEAADTRVFRPADSSPVKTPAAGDESVDIVWIGNWGDDERTRELRTFLFAPVRALGLRARAHGVRYPPEARRELDEAGIEYRGWIANFEVPAAYAGARVTVHIPRRPYVEALPGIPTIRPFEALACGIPLVCSPWEDREGLFTPGRDYLVAPDGEAMRECLHAILNDAGLARALSDHGRRTVLERHTCAHRVDELMDIAVELGLRSEREPEARPLEAPVRTVRNIEPEINRRSVPDIDPSIDPTPNPSTPGT
jgi:spore maturation protein CgeB